MCDMSLCFRNASLVMNAETAGEHTVKYEDSVLRNELVSMLRGTHSRPLYVFLKHLNVDFLYICFCHFSFHLFSDACQDAGKSAAKVYQRSFWT